MQCLALKFSTKIFQQISTILEFLSGIGLETFSMENVHSLLPLSSTAPRKKIVDSMKVESPPEDARGKSTPCILQATEIGIHSCIQMCTKKHGIQVYAQGWKYNSSEN